MGIEPTAFSLARRRSTGELRPRAWRGTNLTVFPNDFPFQLRYAGAVNASGIYAHFLIC